MHIHNFHSSLKHLASGKFLCQSLFLSTAWFLCDISANQAYAEATTEAKTEKSSEENKSTENKTKDEKAKAKDNEFKPVFSKNINNVLNMPDTSIDDFDEITKKIFAKKDHGYTDTIDSAMTSAYETNPDIKTQRAALRATDEGVVQAKAGWRPTLTGTLTTGLQNNRVNGQIRANNFDSASSNYKSGTQQAQVQLQQNLFQGGNTVYSTRAATANVKAGRAQLEDQVQKTLLETTTSYLTLLAKYAEVQYYKDNEEIQKKGLEQNMAKAEVGDETRTTVAQAEYSYTQAVGNRVKAEGELEQLKADYEKVTNKKPGNLVVPEIPLLPDSLEAVLEKVRLNNPQILQAQFDELSARHTVDINQSALLPKIELTASSSANINRNQDKKKVDANPADNVMYFRDKTVNNSVQLQMTVPLYEQGATRSKTRQAAENAGQKRIRIETVRRETLDRATRSWSAFIAAKENKGIYKDQMKAAAASIEGVRQEVEVGAKLYIDLINETERLVNAQKNYVEAERVYLSSAFEILYWMGVLTPETQKLPVEIYNPKIHFDAVKNKI